MTFRIAVCDDEIADLNTEKEQIANSLPQNLDWEIDTFLQSDMMLRSPKIYHMVFLDVEMDGLNGIETAEMIHRKSPVSLIFFVTNHEDYMDQALNKHAFRFWTKPLNHARLLYGIQSAVKEISVALQSITVLADRKEVRILLKNIIYVCHSSRQTEIVTAEGSTRTYDTFQSVTAQLSDACFFQTHASCFVNLNYVTDYNKTDVVCTSRGQTFHAFISKRRYAAFDKRFREWSCELR